MDDPKFFGVVTAKKIGRSWNMSLYSFCKALNKNKLKFKREETKKKLIKKIKKYFKKELKQIGFHFDKK